MAKKPTLFHKIGIIRLHYTSADFTYRVAYFIQSMAFNAFLDRNLISIRSMMPYQTLYTLIDGIMSRVFTVFLITIFHIKWSEKCNTQYLKFHNVSNARKLGQQQSHEQIDP